MAKRKSKSLLGIYASLTSSSPIAREQALTRINGMYDGDGQRIAYASECASKKIFFYGNSEHGMQPDPNVVRADFAAWLVINKVKPGLDSKLLSAEAEWKLMERISKIDDKLLTLMALEAGISPMPAAGAEVKETSALQLFCESAKAAEVHAFLALVPEAMRTEAVNYIDGKGRNAVHSATHNPNVGVITELKRAGADLDVVWQARLGKREPKRAAHMAVLAGNLGVATELGGLALHQFTASPACPVTPYEMGMLRIQNNLSEVPRPVPMNAKAEHAKNPMQMLPPTNPQEADEAKERALRLQRIMEATDIAAGFLGISAPFGNTGKVEAAQRAVGAKSNQHGLN